jgi:hypothetical protein
MERIYKYTGIKEQKSSIYPKISQKVPRYPKISQNVLFCPVIFLIIFLNIACPEGWQLLWQGEMRMEIGKFPAPSSYYFPGFFLITSSPLKKVAKIRKKGGEYGNNGKN